SCQHTERGGAKGKPRRGTDARCLLAKSQRGAELEITACCPARALQALPFGGTVARRTWRRSACLQRRSRRRRTQPTDRSELRVEHSRPGASIVGRARTTLAASTTRNNGLANSDCCADPLQCALNRG